jgi:Legume lectin domain
MKNLRRRTVLVGLSAGFLLAAGHAAADVDYPGFPNTEGLQLNGTATQQPGDYLRLTHALSNQAGSVFTTKRVVRPDKSFKTSFAFALANAEPPRALPRRGTGPPPPPPRGADGMAFVIQNGDAEQLGGIGGDLGYGGIRKSIAVEFDLHANEGEPSDNHVGIVKQGKPETHLAAADPPFDLYGGGLRFAWVNYSAEKKRLKAWVSETDAKPATPTVSARVNLESVLDGRSRAGFTASTGADYETADIDFWKLKQ